MLPLFLLDGPLGDRVVHTGLPAACRRLTGEPLRVGSLNAAGEVYLDLYGNNPDAVVVRGTHTGPWVTPKAPWQHPPGVFARTYRPSLSFFDLAGEMLAARDVRPRLPRTRPPVPRLAVVCDEAGWESRRGYPYFNNVVQALRGVGWKVALLRNVGKGPRQVTRYDHFACFLDHNEAIAFMQHAALFVGYDSAMAHVAGALDIPYVLFCGAVAAVQVRHPSCIAAFDACASACNSKTCPSCCLARLPDHTGRVLDAVEEVARWA